MAQIIDGKLISKQIKDELKDKVAELKNEGKEICLAVIQVGNDPASTVYVGNKKKACEYIGIKSLAYEVPEETTEEELLGIIDKLNKDDSVHGILVQLPVPKHINEETILNSIAVEKDVDAFHPVNVGKIMIGDFYFLPCTPAGVMEMLEYEGIDVTGKNCVVIGRSNIVGKPMNMLLLHKNGTVTICHSRTQNLKDVCNQADILICAIGKPRFFTKDYIKPSAVIIDVGINHDENGKLCGDVNFDDVISTVSAITPVPGGVGPMTVAMLMENCRKAAYEIYKEREI